MQGVEAWYLDDPEARRVPKEKLDELGVLQWHLDAESYETDPALNRICEERGYDQLDIITIAPDRSPDDEERVERFSCENVRDVEEGRYCLEGSGYLEVQDANAQWIRIWTKRGDMVVLPAGICHRFSPAEMNFVKVVRLFIGGSNEPEDRKPTRMERETLSVEDEAAMVLNIRKLFLKGRSFVEHQLASFNSFCDMVPTLFEETEEINIDVPELGLGAKIKFHNASLTKLEVKCKNPARQAYLQKRTYAAQLHADVTVQYGDLFQTTPKILFGEIPVMVHSKLCHLERRKDNDSEGAGSRDGKDELAPGAYFIIEGTERALVAQEADNPLRVNVSNRKEWKAYVSCPTRGLLSSMSIYTVKLQQCSFTIFINSVAREVPVTILLRALGMLSERALLEVMTQNVLDGELCDIVKKAIDQDEGTLLHELGERAEVGNQNVNLEFLGRKLHLGVPAVKKLLEVEFFPDLSFKSKALALGHMVRRLCLGYLGREPQNDRYSLKSKRLQCAGELFTYLLKHSVSRLRNDLGKKLPKYLKLGRRLDPETFIDSSIITKDFCRAFKTGNWPGRFSENFNGGVSVVLERQTPLESISSLRKIKSSALYSGRGGKARMLNEADYGRICPVESPDNDKLGLLKSMALLSVITVDRTTEQLELRDMRCLEGIAMVDLHQWRKIFLNGRWIGVVKPADAEELINDLRRSRREGLIHVETEVAFRGRDQDISIFTDSGRVLRPLLVLKDGHLALTSEIICEFKRRATDAAKLQLLLGTGVVELLGPEEEECCLIATSLKDVTSSSRQYTHMELYMAAIFSLSANAVPFVSHNQSNRVMHQAQKHSKQAQELYYPQKPLVRTWTWETLGRDDLLNGQSCIVAVACYGGYNQEDSIILNKSSVDRGLFVSQHSHRYGRLINTKKTDERFCKPSIFDVGGFSHRFSLDKLEFDGLPFVGAKLGSPDVVIGKVSSGEQERHRDKSVCVKNFESGRVKEVILIEDEEGRQVRSVELLHVRVPQPGDKFSSFHGQKGVVGALLNQEDLPFTRQGIVPDLIINPHAFPTRETLGQLLESVAGKAKAMSERQIRATAFESSSAEQLAEALHRCGFQRWGKESFCEGLNGKQIKAKIFVGPAFYQRLKQVAENNIKWRRIGKVNERTRQPIKDRRAHGGVQFGEMERDCMLAHGATATLQERLFLLSDPYQVLLCCQCQRIANLGRQRLPSCKFCKTNKDNFTTVALPYAVKLLVQELNSMCIDVNIQTETRGREH